MGKLAKVAIGCVVFAIVCVVLVVIGLGGLAWWGKGKIEKIAAVETQIQEAQKKADAVAFTEPADGVLSEERLLKFLEVRKRVFAVYEKHQADIEALKNKKDGGVGDLAKAFGFINEIRQEQAQAQADIGMSSAEYQYMVQTVYKTMWASEITKSSDGKSLSETTSEAYDKMVEAAKSAATTPEAQKAVEAMQEQAAAAKEAAQQADVPPANIALFRKYESDIKKYAMNGLELIGL